MPGRRRKLTKEKIEELFKLAEIGCTQREIAYILKIDESQLRRAYAPEYEAGISKLKESLRRTQIELAKAGNVSMLVWLGKQYLGQTDKLSVPEKLEDLSDDELRVLARRALGSQVTKFPKPA